MLCSSFLSAWTSSSSSLRFCSSGSLSGVSLFDHEKSSMPDSARRAFPVVVLPSALASSGAIRSVAFTLLVREVGFCDKVCIFCDPLFSPLDSCSYSSSRDASSDFFSYNVLLFFSKRLRSSRFHILSCILVYSSLLESVFTYSSYLAVRASYLIMRERSISFRTLTCSESHELPCAVTPYELEEQGSEEVLK